MRLRGAFHGMMAPDHADGLADESPNLPPMLGCASSSKGNVVGQPGVVVERRRRAGDGCLGDDVEHAGLTGPDLAHVLGPLLQLGGDGPQVLGPLLRG